jgi:Sec1 family
MTMEGVYLITPSEDSVRGLIRDFESPTRPMYKGAHVFFTEGKSIVDDNHSKNYKSIAIDSGTNQKLRDDQIIYFHLTIILIILFPFFHNQKKNNIDLAIPDSLFEKIKGQNVVKFMRACKEINIAFIPYEEQV